MTLKEKILSDNYLEDYDTPITDYQADNIVERADYYAIEVLEHYHNGLFFIPLKDGEARKILEHIKKEKGL